MIIMEHSSLINNTASAYLNTMKLPALVNATSQQPLGPDCIITNSKDHDAHKNMLSQVKYYWYISLAKGCVECVVKQPKDSSETATTSDPRCVVTRKHRRFEAYCCMLCRSNFVTVVQALLHLKAHHRSTDKIFVHDQDVFSTFTSSPTPLGQPQQSTSPIPLPPVVRSTPPPVQHPIALNSRSPDHSILTVPETKIEEITSLSTSNGSMSVHRTSPPAVELIPGNLKTTTTSSTSSSSSMSKVIAQNDELVQSIRSLLTCFEEKYAKKSGQSPFQRQPV